MVTKYRVAHRIIDRSRVFRKFSIDETIAIIGSPRTGTTWLMQLIGDLPQYCTIFEPLHKTWFPETKNLNYFSRPYVPQGHNDLELVNYLSKVFCGDVYSKKPHFDINKKEVFRRVNAKRITVKFVRAARLTPWISDNFNLRKILIIDRNPHSTIASQIKTGYNGLMSKESPSYLKKCIMNEIKQVNAIAPDIMHEIENIDNDEGLLTVIYCVDKIVSHSIQSEGLVHIKYEDLFLHKEKVLKKILSQLDELDSFNSILEKSSEPSMVSSKSSRKSLADPEIQLNKWKTQLNQNQIRNIDEVLNLFKTT